MSFKSKAAVMQDVGDPDVLTMDEIELSWPGQDDEVLVRIEMAGINPADTFFRSLGPYLGDGRGTVLGHDAAGVVEAVGRQVKEVRTGDRVCFCNGGIGDEPGTYSEYAVVPEWLLAKIPQSVDSAQAAALPLVFITAWESLVDRARVAADHRVLIHGGAGGTGHVAIQVARQHGARVATTVSSEAKFEYVRSLGVDCAINYRQQDFIDEVKRWSSGKGVDIAFDNVGARVFTQSLKAMAPYGRIVTLMGVPGDTEDEDAYNKNIDIHNVMMLTPMWYGLESRRRNQARIVRQGMAWLDTGRIEIKINSTFPLAQVADAHRRLEQGGTIGKILLTI